MLMVVECDSCHSRFRVKKTLLEGAFAIRFRCRSCGGIIVVRNPEMRKIAAVPSPTPPLPSVPPEAPAAPAAPPEPVIPAIADKPAAPAAAVTVTARLENLVPYPPEDEARAGGGGIGRTVAVNRVATATRSTTFKKTAWVIGILLFLAGVGILLFASGAFHFGDSNPEGGSPGRKSSLPGSSGAARASSRPVYDVQKLDSYMLREAIAGNLFVITGTVRNVGKSPSRGIRLRATLFGKDDKVLMEQASIAGNYLDKGTLPYMTRPAIDLHLAERSEEGTGNRDIPPGTSLSFVVVCFDPPEKVEKFKVLAADADP